MAHPVEGPTKYLEKTTLKLECFARVTHGHVCHQACENFVAHSTLNGLADLAARAEIKPLTQDLL